jgi:hypothetical protein
MADWLSLYFKLPADRRARIEVAVTAELAAMRTCKETHYYCVSVRCEWVGHNKPCERRCPACGAQVWKEGSFSVFKEKALRPFCKNEVNEEV